MIFLLAFLKNKWTKRFCIAISILVLIVITSNIWINVYSSNYLYDDISKIETHDVGVVLGTSNRLKNGRKNWFFEYRIRAAAELYHNKKVKYLVLSGDNSNDNYDEPGMMKTELVKRGVPECAITCDYAGLRTFDSMIRMKKVFGLNSFIIISQKFHNQRAVFIARKNNINAIGFNAKDLSGMNGIKTHIREYFARFKTVLDIYILNTNPKFLGESLTINHCEK